MKATTPHIILTICSILICLGFTSLNAQQKAEGTRHKLKQKLYPEMTFVEAEDEVAVLEKHSGLTIKSPQGLSREESVSYNRMMAGKEPETDRKTYRVFYRNGIKSPSNRYIATGKILVSFGKGSTPSYAEFAKENNLEFIREINQLYHTAVFQIKDPTDLISKVNQLNQNPTIRNATPDWISPRSLK